MADIDSSKKDYKKYFFMSAVSLIVVIAIIAAVYYIALQPRYTQYYNQQFTKCTEQNKEFYLLLMAQRTGDEKYCEEKQVLKNKCLAYARKNPDLYCNEMVGTALESCRAEVLQDASKCPKDDNWCFAYASGNPQFCNKLGKEDTEECKKTLPNNAEYWISNAAQEECKKTATSAADSRMKLRLL